MLVSPQELRRRILTDEFDFRTIMSVLEEYSHPRDRITRLLEQGVILQIRRGLYIFAEPFAKHPLSRELLANLVHGPSYVSMESALEYHAMIPERTKAVTSASFSRGRSFETPVGLFIYRRVPERVFSIGVERVEIPGGRSFLMARPEKALADMVHIDRGLELRSFRAVEEYLYVRRFHHPIKEDPLGSQQKTEYTYPYPSQVVFQCLLNALQNISGMKVTRHDKPTGAISVSSGISWKSWGESITIRVADSSDGQCRVIFQSASDLALIDWGKNKDNIEQIVQALAHELAGPRLASPSIVDSVAPAGMNFCPNCGVKLLSFAKFCSSCGAKLQ